MNWVAYHDRTGTDHQTQFDDLYPRGWRMISLSVYGARGDERYAAIWVERPGPDWSAVHGLDGAGYQVAFNTAVAAGFVPVLLAATGPANDPVFAGTFEQSAGPVPLTRFGLTRGAVSDAATIDHWIDQANSNNWYPTSVAIYGAPGDRRYAAIFVANPDRICWTLGLDDAAQDHQSRFDALVPAGGTPSLVAVSPDTRCASIFADQRFPGWVARHGMASAGYQAEFNALTAKGMVPVSVQGGGVGAGARFSALFATSFDRESLSWRTPTGPVTVAAIDNVMRQAMQRHRIRGAGLALVREGRLVYARGYTYAEPGYPTIQPTTFFRQASVSKMIVALAAHRLVEQGRLTFATPIQSILGLQRPDGGAPASSFSSVTVQHLLEHTSGLPSNPYGIEPSVVAAFNTGPNPGAFSLPVDGRMTDRYMVTLPATSPPVTAAYNNWGYFLLGHVVMAVTGAASLDAALDALLFQPLGITRIRLARTRAESQAPDEAKYHPTRFWTGGSLVDPDRRLRSNGYGGFWNLERDDAGGGLSGAVVDVARLLAMLDVRTGNPVMQPAAIANLFSMAAAGGGHGFDFASVVNASAGTYYGMKGGSLPESSQNCARYRTDDFSMVVCWNRSDITEGGNDGWWYPDFPAVLNAARAATWSDTDLFPSFGMPTFEPPRAGCLSFLVPARGVDRTRSTAR
jgi:CubicO group peptidase (beta-lactamase class C family)